MKRVKAACICQTLHFMLKEDVAHDWAVKQVEQDVENYKKTLERNRTQYRIFEQTTDPMAPLCSRLSSSTIPALLAII